MIYDMFSLRFKIVSTHLIRDTLFSLSSVDKLEMFMLFQKFCSMQWILYDLWHRYAVLWPVLRTRADLTWWLSVICRNTQIAIVLGGDNRYYEVQYDIQ